MGWSRPAWCPPQASLSSDRGSSAPERYASLMPLRELLALLVPRGLRGSRDFYAEGTMPPWPSQSASSMSGSAFCAAEHPLIVGCND